MSDNFEDQIIWSGEISFEAQGKQYSVSPLPLKMIVNDEFQNSDIWFPRQSNPGENQLFNVSTKESREATDKWIRLFLKKNGSPMSLDEVCDDGWTIVDIGRFLSTVVQISG